MENPTNSTGHISDEMIEQLRDEAAAAGDEVLVVLCDIALGDGPQGNDGDAWEERYGGGGLDIPRREQDRLQALTQEEALAECARSIAYPAAMDEDVEPFQVGDASLDGRRSPMGGVRW